MKKTLLLTTIAILIGINSIAMPKGNNFTEKTMSSKDGKNYAGCFTKNDIKQMLSFLAQNDYRAAESMVNQRRCFLVPAKLDYSLIDYSMFGGYAEIKLYLGKTALDCFVDISAISK